MLSFRPLTPEPIPAQALDLLAIGHLIDDAMRPGHFFVASQVRLAWIAARAETIPWEIFHGRLLEPSQTRMQKTFLSWNLTEENEAPPATEPTISVKYDIHERVIHVTRGLLLYAWEGYDAGGGVIESRETIRWTRELVGTIPLEQFADAENLRDELICLIWQAIVGTSRLPLTSVETPLPAFAFGQLHYIDQPDLPENNECLTCWQELFERGLRPGLAWREYVKTLEVALRNVRPDELPGMAELFSARWQGIGHSVPALLRALFNDVSLSPYTRFVDNALIWVDLLTRQGTLTADEKIDFLGHLLRQLGRHLTAYDLVTFHHRGANYPDALLLDAVLKAYGREIEAQPASFEGDPARLRRRALRQGCLLRRRYEGHLVPDQPTSPGENARILPASHPRVPEAQLLQSYRRRRQLFADDPLSGLLHTKARHVLALSVRDLVHLDERTELGLGVFIDRPLGYGKAVGEPDLTPLLAHEAFSLSLARRRWQELLRLCEEAGVPIDQASLQPLFDRGPWPTGLPHAKLAECPRPSAALTDVRKVADDFMIVRTLPVGLRGMLRRLEFRPVLKSVRLAVQVLNEANEPRLVLFDEQLRPQVELEIDSSQGYVTRAGVEWPKGLRIR